MSKRKSPSNEPKHLLLLYARLFALWRGPALVVAAIAGVLAAWAPGALSPMSVRIPLAGVSVLSGVIFVYALIGPRLSYVQCRPNHLLLSTPLFRLTISYNRIHTTRPVPFNPDPIRWSDHRLVGPFLGQTQVAMDLNRYPISRRWLRFFLIDYLLPTNFVGLQFLVRDWMGLSLNIEAHRAAWKTRQRDRERKDTLTSLTVKRRF